MTNAFRKLGFDIIVNIANSSNKLLDFHTTHTMAIELI